MPDKSSNYDPPVSFQPPALGKETPLIPKEIMAGAEPVSGSDRVDLGEETRRSEVSNLVRYGSAPV